MDMYEVARIDKETGIENVGNSTDCTATLVSAPLTHLDTSQIMKNLLTLRDEGHFKYISLSECVISADRLRTYACL